MASEDPESSFKVTDRRRRGEDEAPPPADPDRSLVGLFMMLSSSAVMALGEEDPATGERDQADLPMAAELIDVLALLREKTDGRRTAEESHVLDQILYDLQMRYVSLTRRPG